jgi:hypothetical protein
MVSDVPVVDSIVVDSIGAVVPVAPVVPPPALVPVVAPVATLVEPVPSAELVVVPAMTPVGPLALVAVLETDAVLLVFSPVVMGPVTPLSFPVHEKL